MDEKQVFQRPKKQRYLVLIVLVGLVVLAGVWIAILMPSSYTPSQTTTTSTLSGQPIVTEIIIGTLSSPEEMGRPNPHLTQQNSYEVNSPLGLRATVDPDHKSSTVELNVRLVDDNGRVHNMSPSSITMQRGTSTFCCWTLEHEGDFTLQIFRPEKNVTSIPIRVGGYGGAVIPKF